MKTKTILLMLLGAMTLNTLSAQTEYNTGKVKSEIAYKTGEKEDSYKLYYPETGKVREEGRCENGREVYRKTYEYDGKGNLISARERQ